MAKPNISYSDIQYRWFWIFDRGWSEAIHLSCKFFFFLILYHRRANQNRIGFSKQMAATLSRCSNKAGVTALRSASD